MYDLCTLLRDDKNSLNVLASLSSFQYCCKDIITVHINQERIYSDISEQYTLAFWTSAGDY